MAYDKKPNNDFDDIEWLSSQVDSSVSSVGDIALEELEKRFNDAKIMTPVDYMANFVRIETESGSVLTYDPVLQLRYGVLCAIYDELGSNIPMFQLVRGAVMTSFPLKAFNDGDYEYSKYVAESLSSENELTASVRNDIAFIASYGGFMEGSHLAVYPVCDSGDERKFFDNGLMHPQHVARVPFYFNTNKVMLTFDKRIHVFKEVVKTVTLVNGDGESIE